MARTAAKCGYGSGPCCWPWSRLDVSASLNESVQALALVPASNTANPPTVYACTPSNNFYRSADGGTTWSGPFPTGGGTYCYSIAVQGMNLWVPSVTGGVRQSTDNGTTWNPTGMTTSSYGLAIAPGATGPATLYAGTLNGISKSVNGGAAWTTLSATDLVSAMLVDPAAPTTVFAGMTCGTGGTGVSGTGGIKRSTSSGMTWGAAVGDLCVNSMLAVPNGDLMAVGPAGRGSRQFAVGADQGLPGTAGGAGMVGEGVGVAASSDGKTVYVGSTLGLYKSVTGGL